MQAMGFYPGDVGLWVHYLDGSVCVRVALPSKITWFHAVDGFKHSFESCCWGEKGRVHIVHISVWGRMWKNTAAPPKVGTAY